MANALVSMGVPVGRLVGLDRHTWRLPGVVCNFADELRDQFALADVHHKATRGGGQRTDGLRCGRPGPRGVRAAWRVLDACARSQ